MTQVASSIGAACAVKKVPLSYPANSPFERAADPRSCNAAEDCPNGPTKMKTVAIWAGGGQPWVRREWRRYVLRISPKNIPTPTYRNDTIMTGTAARAEMACAWVANRPPVAATVDTDTAGMMIVVGRCRSAASR